MEISPIDAVRALGKLIDPLPQIREEAQVAVLKKALEARSAQTLALIEGIQQNPDQRIDLKV